LDWDSEESVLRLERAAFMAFLSFSCCFLASRVFCMFSLRIWLSAFCSNSIGSNALSCENWFSYEGNSEPVRTAIQSTGRRKWFVKAGSAGYPVNTNVK
jgi:hypothetical protein